MLFKQYSEVRRNKLTYCLFIHADFLILYVLTALVKVTLLHPILIISHLSASFDPDDHSLLLEIIFFAWFPLHTILTPLLTMEHPRIQSFHHFYFISILYLSDLIQLHDLNLYSDHYLFSICRLGIPLNSRH